MCLHSILAYVQQVLTAYQAEPNPDKRDYRLKDAALLVLGTLKKARKAVAAPHAPSRSSTPRTHTHAHTHIYIHTPSLSLSHTRTHALPFHPIFCQLLPANPKQVLKSPRRPYRAQLEPLLLQHVFPEFTCVRLVSVCVCVD